jgi:hypothetical protein
MFGVVESREEGQVEFSGEIMSPRLKDGQSEIFEKKSKTIVTLLK